MSGILPKAYKFFTGILLEKSMNVILAFYGQIRSG